VKQKYSTVEQLIEHKAGGVADAKKRAESLQKEAKELLLQASDKLQQLKGYLRTFSMQYIQQFKVQSILNEKITLRTFSSE